MSFDREELVRLRAAYVQREGDPSQADQVPPERIWAAAAGELTPAETEELALRAAEDPELASLWAMALDCGAEVTEDDTNQVAEVLGAGGQVVPLLWKRAAVAALVVGLAASALVFVRPAPDEVWRGDAQKAVTVSAMAVTPEGLLLDWDSAPGATWSVRVFDADLNPVYRADEVAESQAMVPLDALPGGALTWQVIGVWPGEGQVRSPVFELVR